MTTEETDSAATAHQRCSALLRRWLSETHTRVAHGPISLRAAGRRVCTEVVHASPTGAHGFGPIRVLGAEDDERDVVASADPALLAAVLAEEARGRATADAPINLSPPDSWVDSLPVVLGDPERDPALVSEHVGDASLHRLLAQPAGQRPALVDKITDSRAARDWLTEHVSSELLPALRSSAGAAERVTASLLTRGVLAAIGLLGRHGVADEGELLAALSRLLRRAERSEAESPELRSVVRSWLDGPTLADFACMNGSEVRYRTAPADAAVLVEPVPYEVANPLYGPDASVPRVPGVPLPEPGRGWELRPVELTGPDGGPDAALVHGWMNSEHVEANWHQGWSLREWHAELATQLGGEHSVPCIVGRDGSQLAYVELYRVLRDKLAPCYSHDPHDLGVHIAIGEPEATGRGLGSALLRAVAEGLLVADPSCRRVVAEPDVHNAASIAAFTKAGFVRDREVGLPTKNSALMVFTR